MTQTPIYLDHNATTLPFPAVIELVTEVMAEAGNPSAVHQIGRRASGRLETARRQVAALCNARARDVTFSGSATEAHNLLIQHFSGARFLRPASEHDAILAPREGEDLRLTAQGQVDLEALEQRVKETARPVLICITAANNETGLLSPMAEIATLMAGLREQGFELHYHVDAVQAAGKLPIDFAAWACDSLALSAHKMGGPQGVGALITRPGFDIQPLIKGGGQERRRRAGTENVAGIAGFGLACELAAEPFDTSSLQERFEAGLQEINPSAEIVAQIAPRLSNTTCVLTPGKAAETLLMQFDLAGIALSSGSACSSGKVGSSHVLRALGYSDELARSALRFSLGRQTTITDVDRALEVYEAACR